MNSSLDLNLLALARQGGNVTSELADLYAVTPPRRAAHGRDSDSLMIYLTVAGNSPLSPEAQTQLLEQLAQKFYKTSGSLTSALRTLVESLNLFLLDRNLRSTSLGRQGIGQLLLLAMRADTLYMAHCGGVHAFIIAPGKLQHIHDPQSSGRGLGLSRTTPIRFIQTKLAPDDFLVLATVAPANWSESSFIHPQQQGIEGLRQQLLASSGQEFNTVIIQAQAGTGKLRRLKPKINPPDQIEPAPGTQALPVTNLAFSAPPAQSEELPLEDHGLGVPSDEEVTSEMDAQLLEDKGLEVPEAPSEPEEGDSDLAEDSDLVEDRGLGISAGQLAQVPVEEPAQPADEPIDAASPPASTFGQTQASTIPDIPPVEPAPMEAAGTPVLEASMSSKASFERKAPAVSLPNTLVKFFASLRASLSPVVMTILRALRSALATIGTALLRLLKNLLPDADVLQVPPYMMLLIAIAIPVILAVIGGMVFLQRGRAQQSQVFYQKAVEEAAYAANLTNPLEQRLAWQTVLGDLDKAEYYTITTQSQALRAQATSNLDMLDAVKRLDYQQAILGGLDSEINITRIVATTTDIYLLNGRAGSVIHAVMTSRGFEIDPNFECGPTYGPINVGPLVDISELPPGSFENASLLGMDANGNLLYCVIGSQPYSAAMAPPNTGFGAPTAMSLDRGDLFLLDPEVNAVWIYRNLEVTQQPRLFFGDNIPPMQDVIDLTVYNNDLFLLHADGHTTKCTYSGMAESPTRCADPYPYSDNRPGREHGPTIQDAVFNQIYFSSFPERSIYTLDPQNRSIYYFSVLLTLQWQYQSKNPLPEGNATAFAISPNRMAFMAIGNNIFYAALP
jgi:hypothetical protein